MHAPAERGRVESMAEVTLRAVPVQDAWNATVYARVVFTGKPEDAVGVRATPWRHLDASLALARNVDALAFWTAVRGGLAGAASGKHAVTDRCTVDGVASRLDAREASRAVLTRLAKSIGGTRKAKHAGHASGLRATCPAHTAGTSTAGVTADAAVTARTARSTVFATN